MPEAFGRQSRVRRSIEGDPAVAQQDDAFDLGDDFFDVMRHDDRRRAAAGERANRLHESMAGHEIETGGRLVQQEGIRASDQRPRNQHATTLAGGHLVQRFRGKVFGRDAVERFGRRPAHLVGDVVIAEHALAAEQSRQRDVEPANAAAGRAPAEASVEISGDDAETLAATPSGPTIARAEEA